MALKNVISEGFQSLNNKGFAFFNKGIACNDANMGPTPRKQIELNALRNLLKANE